MLSNDPLITQNVYDIVVLHPDPLESAAVLSIAEIGDIALISHLHRQSRAGGPCD